MSDSMINMKILRKCGGELKHAIKCRCLEPFSTEDYINSMEEIITRTKIANTCTKKTNISEVQVIEEAQCTEEEEESDLDSAVSDDTPVEDYPIGNIAAFFEVTEVHAHLAHYSEECHNLINIQDATICKDDHQAILPGWKNHLLPIEGENVSGASNNMYPLGILVTNLVFPHPAGSVRMKTEIVVIDNCTSQHIIFGSYYLNIYGIDIHNHKDIYFKIGENQRQKFAFSNIPKQISIISSVKDTYKKEFVSNQLVKAQINYINIDKPHPPVLRRPAYPASPRAREALEKHIQELIQLGVLRKVGHNEEVEVTTPVIISWHNDKLRMVGDFGELNTYTVPDRNPTSRTQQTLTQLSKAKYIASVDALKGFIKIF
ncbi:hypothetical protein O181_093298 [Austropuccinia psidii MF-1]|uniref:Uncharacterized protein n=1 Tax=Austropuccinia psidii MF-1 TaxID=1389203 RepID=A0A9Q3J014_9BASI|nr:hypothetical protein [Austropuccinia psidii MF-1]